MADKKPPQPPKPPEPEPEDYGPKSDDYPRTLAELLEKYSKKKKEK